jgi:HK97 family phage prohead protease
MTHPRIGFLAIIATGNVVDEGGVRRALNIEGGTWETPVPLLFEHRGVVAGEIVRVSRTGKNIVARGFIEDDGKPETARLLADIRAGLARPSVRYSSLRSEFAGGAEQVRAWRLLEVSLTKRPSDRHTSITLDDAPAAPTPLARGAHARARDGGIEHRAYSLLEVKRVSEDARTLTGLATSPTADRMGDIVEPAGAQFKLPIPLLWHHNPREPIGEVFRARVTPAGIEVEARLIKIPEPGTLKDRLDEAWQSIRSGLVKGLSIGFRAIGRPERIDGGGLRFLTWEWLELSAVSIPANAEASIVAVKAAATGSKLVPMGPHGIALVGALHSVTRGKLRGHNFARGLGEMFLEFAQPLAERIKSLETKAVDALRFRGVYEDGRAYSRNDLVQRGGTIWVALIETHATPGKSADWRMLVKSGDKR